MRGENTVRRSAAHPRRNHTGEASVCLKKTIILKTFHLQNENERATSEVQNIQVADGDVPRKWDLPIRIMLPR